MCFHASQIKPVKKIEKYFDVELSDGSLRDLFNTPRYHINGFSHSEMLIIPQEKPNVLAAATWGIVPNNQKVKDIQAYYKEAVKFGGGLNARSEKVFDHFLYKQSIQKKRCIIPITAFFEPHEHQKKRYPFVFKPKDEPFLSLAGIYTRIDKVVTFSILTQFASPLFAKIHNKKQRQPVILSNEDQKKWINSKLNKHEIEHILQNHFDETKLITHPISKDLFSPKVNSNHVEILESVNYKELIEY